MFCPPCTGPQPNSRYFIGQNNVVQKRKGTKFFASDEKILSDEKCLNKYLMISNKNCKSPFRDFRNVNVFMVFYVYSSFHHLLIASGRAEYDWNWGAEDVLTKKKRNAWWQNCEGGAKAPLLHRAWLLIPSVWPLPATKWLWGVPPVERKILFEYFRSNMNKKERSRTKKEKWLSQIIFDLLF